MNIHLNGKQMETQSRTLMDLVKEQALEMQSLVVEYNFEVVSQHAWEDTVLKDGDTIELLSFVGGG